METPDSGQLAVRIGDAERDICLEALGEHHAHGRLTADELDKRQRVALAAVTEADLAALLSDLPSESTSTRSLAEMGQSWMPDQRVRTPQAVKGAAVLASLIAGGVFVADMTTDEHSFFIGLGATALGYVTHLLLSKWPTERQ
jgi:hypothetical protein